MTKCSFGSNVKKQERCITEKTVAFLLVFIKKERKDAENEKKTFISDTHVSLFLFANKNLQSHEFISVTLFASDGVYNRCMTCKRNIRDFFYSYFTFTHFVISLEKRRFFFITIAAKPPAVRLSFKCNSYTSRHVSVFYTAAIYKERV